MKNANQILKAKLKYVLLFFNLLAILSLSQAQIAINEDDSNGDASAALDVKSTTKGVLFPVMTDAERLALKSPATGLIIFNRSGAYFNYYNGSAWIQISRTVVVGATNPVGAGTDVGVGVGVADPDNSAILHVNSVTKGFLLPRNTSAPSSPATGLIYYKTTAASNQIFIYNGTAWEQITSTTLGAAAGGTETSAGLLIGTGTIAPSAKMEISSTTGGLLLPRMTDAQRDAIVSPAEGLLLYNTTSNTVQYFAAATWYKWASGTSNYGQVVGNPGTSCKDIYNNNASSIGVDGTYYINPSGVTYACTCDMTRDGGGWTLVQNTGPKGTVNTGTAASGSVAPISTSNASGALAKLSDTDINALRGGASGYATSCLKVERQNSCQTNKSIYFNKNLAFNSAAIAGANINTYYTTYANYLASSSLQTATPSYASAFDSWTGGTAGYQIIWSYNAEGFITNGCNSTTSCATVNRSECSVLLWVK